MRIYNEQTKQIEEFTPITPGEIKMYVCGPTVYNHIHIGNARPIIFFDFVRRVFEKNGYNVLYVSNITDVDDKIIKQAQLEHTNEEAIVEKNFLAFKQVLEDLGIEYTHQPRVTNTMDQIIDFIAELVKTNHAYVVEGDVYFNVDSIADYGKISNLKIEENKANTRIEKNSKKRNEHDFTLWKETSEGINWPSPWSIGRPGWHTECVVMIRDFFGPTIDIHGGGIDLQFPHHENENAQSCAFDHELANYWMHNGFININDEKMSKSIGNVVLAKDFIQIYGSNVLKLVMYQSNYRQPINLNDQLIKDMQKLDRRLNQFYQHRSSEKKDINLGETKKIVTNDFDSANLITYLMQIIKENTEENSIIFNTIIDIFGLKYTYEENSLPEEVSNLLAERESAKRSKDYAKADAIRAKLEQMGYEVKDTREGSICQKKQM